VRTDLGTAQTEFDQRNVAASLAAKMDLQWESCPWPAKNVPVREHDSAM